MQDSGNSTYLVHPLKALDIPCDTVHVEIHRSRFIKCCTNNNNTHLTAIFQSNPGKPIRMSPFLILLEPE